MSLEMYGSRECTATRTALKALKGQGVQFINCDAHSNHGNSTCAAAQGYPTFVSDGKVCDLGFSTIGGLQEKCNVIFPKS